jgi:hypothetical protein
MIPRPADTSPEVWERYVTMLMARSNTERFLMGIRMFDAARRMALLSAPGDLPPDQFRAWLYERTYGEPLPSWAMHRGGDRKVPKLPGEQPEGAAAPSAAPAAD